MRTVREDLIHRAKTTRLPVEEIVEAVRRERPAETATLTLEGAQRVLAQWRPQPSQHLLAVSAYMRNEGPLETVHDTASARLEADPPVPPVRYDRKAMALFREAADDISIYRQPGTVAGRAVLLAALEQAASALAQVRATLDTGEGA